MYSSDTVYSTTTFRPVSPSPITQAPVAPNTPSPQRTRKLETPLHFDGGLFSDIRSMDGKLLSKVTVDRVHSSTRHDVTDSPSVYEGSGSHGSKDFVDNLTKTETITNEDVIKVKFTPVPQEIDTPPRLLTPSQFRERRSVSRTRTPVEYLKDTYEDLQSYKIVSSLLHKEKQLETVKMEEKFGDSLKDMMASKRPHSPLANLLVSEQLTKIDTYLQESLDACKGDGQNGITPLSVQTEGEIKSESIETSNSFMETVYQFETNTNGSFTSYHIDNGVNKLEDVQNKPITQREDENVSPQLTDDLAFKTKSKVNSVNEKQGVLKAIYNMPIHYHAAILCLLLIVYNFIYQYIKKNCHGQK